MTVDSCAAVRSNIMRSRVLCTVSPKVMSCKTIVEYDNQGIDTDLVKIQIFPSTQGSLILRFIATPTYFPSPPCLSPWKSQIFFSDSVISEMLCIWNHGIGCFHSAQFSRNLFRYVPIVCIC